MVQKWGGRVPSGPLTRLKPAEIDPLEEYGLPSKGENRLLSPERQEAFYSVITSRYLDLCTQAGDKDGLRKKFAELTMAENKNTANSSGNIEAGPKLLATSPPPPSSPFSPPTSTLHNKKPPTTDLSQIFVALRTLREALVASQRRDEFTTQVFLFSIRQGILVASYETYYPALLYLVRVLHPGQTTADLRALPSTLSSTVSSTAPPPPASAAHRLPPRPYQPEVLSRLEHTEVVSYLVLDAACRLGDLSTAHTLRRLYGLHDAKVDTALRALASDNWVLWRRVKRSVDGHRARLMDLAEPQMRSHVLKAFGRAYLTIGRDFLERQADCVWAELRARYGVGWELNEAGERVVIRKVQARTDAK